jgi:hypothetical protein
VSTDWKNQELFLNFDVSYLLLEHEYEKQVSHLMKKCRKVNMKDKVLMGERYLNFISLSDEKHSFPA